MKKLFLFLIVMMFLVSFVGAAAPHGINGYVADSDDGTYANGAAVVMFVDIRPDERLTDMVGIGNAQEDNWYSFDLENFETPWNDGERLIFMIVKDETHSAMAELIIDSSGGKDSQQAPNTKLGNCEGAYCSYCGDNICDTACNETITSCPQDCGGAYCGEGFCTGTEDYLNCPEDCPAPLCGNGLCEFEEDHLNCPEDCGLGCNYDSICDFGESFTSCPDCMIESCGNMFCEPIFGESEETCPSDCGSVVCGDGVCEVKEGENSENCPTDCKRTRCGNGICEPDENEENCCLDCKCSYGECVGNKCMSCGFLGIYGTFFTLCWYIWLVIILATGLAVYFIVRWKIKQTHTIKHFSKMSKIAVPKAKKKR
jgi:hypothetical protein